MQAARPLPLLLLAPTRGGAVGLRLALDANNESCRPEIQPLAPLGL
jgi:hypothetical protein